MTNPDQPVEETTGGVLGKLAGKAKAAAGSLTGNDTLAREGRLQEAQVDAERDAQRELAEARQREQEAELSEERNQLKAERERLQQEVAAEDREQRIERDAQKAQLEADREAARQQAAAEQRHQADEERAARLEEEARRLETTAAVIDPEETR